MKDELITRNVTEFSIGDSGFYFSKNKIGDYIIEEAKHISGNLYEITLRGMKTVDSDDLSITSAICWDMNVLDLDCQEIHQGYSKKINESLYAIFDIQSIETGWPAHDVIIIKNVVTGDKITIEFEAAASEEIKADGDLYILSGSIFDQIDYKEQKEWKVFMDQDGKIIYKGFCWEYQLLSNKLLVKKFKTSKRFVERILN